jgi:hypothetical protein
MNSATVSGEPSATRPRPVMSKFRRRSSGKAVVESPRKMMNRSLPGVLFSGGAGYCRQRAVESVELRTPADVVDDTITIDRSLPRIGRQ